MPETTARILDRVNEWLVHWRVGGRQPVPDRRQFEEYVEEIGDRVFPDPAELGPFEPTSAGGPEASARPGRGTWRTPTPWPDAEGPNREWWATRTSPSGPSPPDTAVIVVHGWLAARWNYPLYLAWCRWLSGFGFEAWTPRLPHHLERAAEGRVSGERCLSSDLVSTTDSIRQAVTEVRMLARWLRGEGRRRVALWGMSLGGWVAALTATLDPDWDAVVLWAPVADLEATLWESSFSREIRAAVRAGGLSRGDATEALAALSPVDRDLRVPPERVLLVAGRHDGIVDPWSLVRLGVRWGTGIWWVPHGHISLLVSPATLAGTRRFLTDRLRGGAVPDGDVGSPPTMSQ